MDPEKLKDFLLALVVAPELQPKFDTTGKFLESFCNLAVQRTGGLFNYHKFDGLRADAICTFMANSSDWTPADGEAFSAAAMNGEWTVAGLTSKILEQADGHVASGFPAPMQMSGSLNCLVPTLANVGITCGITKESEDFPVPKGQPNYFIFNANT